MLLTCYGQKYTPFVSPTRGCIPYRKSVVSDLVVDTLTLQESTDLHLAFRAHMRDTMSMIGIMVFWELRWRYEIISAGWEAL